MTDTEGVLVWLDWGEVSGREERVELDPIVGIQKRLQRMGTRHGLATHHTQSWSWMMAIITMSRRLTLSGAGSSSLLLLGFRGINRQVCIH